MSTSFDDLDSGALVKCADCGWRGSGGEVDEIDDIQSRLTPGDTVPAGQCPLCGALAYVEGAERESKTITFYGGFSPEFGTRVVTDSSGKVRTGDFELQASDHMYEYTPGDSVARLVSPCWDSGLDALEELPLSQEQIDQLVDSVGG